MKSLLLFTCSVCLLYSCQTSTNNFGVAGRYLPWPAELATGVVNKYYFHYQSEDGYEKSTDIRYHQYKQLDEQRLSISIYGPGFELTSRRILRFTDDKMLVEDEVRRVRGETINTQLLDNILLDWQQDTASYHAITQYPYGSSEELSWKQISIRDTLIMGRPAKVFARQNKRLYQYPEEKGSNYQTEVIDKYVQDYGLFYSSYTSEEGTGSLELVKQMPSVAFEALSRKAPPRVAYIDPNNTLDFFSSFAPCNDEGQIYDYYNGRPDAHYRQGKRGLWKIFNEQVDPLMLGQETGYLTFRFVINCSGETGWFVTEEADLDFNIKTFPETCVSHLYDIVRQLDDWQPAIAREEAIDTYAYLTLKLKNGKIIEILP